MRFKNKLQFTMRLFCSLLTFGLVLFVSGCGTERLEYTETKRISEKVSEKELKVFLRVVNALPDKKLPAGALLFASPPRWDTSRTLPVSELVLEERDNIAQRWDTNWQAENLPHSRALNRALKKQKMSKKQFVSLATTIGMAMSRNQVRKNQDLYAIRQSGTVAIAKLNKDQTSFSKHTLDEQHYILNQAVWIIRIDRVNHLLLVPPENIALVQKHIETLNKIFPDEQTANPFDDIADLLHERGLPFEGNEKIGGDVEIRWNREAAIIGNDSL